MYGRPVKPSSWDEFFLRQVYLYAARSKDLSSKMGAIIVNPNTNTVLSGGYNGLCRKVNDLKQNRHHSPEKYFWYEHAERNAIYNAARNGIATDNQIMYTNGIPCTDCMRGIIQSGIVKLYTHLQCTSIQLKHSTKYADHFDRAYHMMAEAGVQLLQVDKTLNVSTTLSGKVWEV